MATYKKRGHKPQTKEEKQSAIEKESTTAEVFNTLDEKASKTEEWVAKNQKYIYIIIAVVAVAVLGWLAYNQFIQKPKETEAANEMYQAQIYFEQALSAQQKDSLFILSLNGGMGKYGFLDIIDNYGGTDAANNSRYYAGIAYMHLGNYKEAIIHLDKHKSKDEIVGPIAKGNIGDAFAELNQLEDALKYYKQAASMSANEFTAPKYLLKSAIVALELGKAGDALSSLNKIKSDFPESAEAGQIDIYIGMAEAMK